MCLGRFSSILCIRKGAFRVFGGLLSKWLFFLLYFSLLCQEREGGHSIVYEPLYEADYILLEVYGICSKLMVLWSAKIASEGIYANMLGVVFEGSGWCLLSQSIFLRSFLLVSSWHCCMLTSW